MVVVEGASLGPRNSDIRDKPDEKLLSSIPFNILEIYSKALCEQVICCTLDKFMSLPIFFVKSKSLIFSAL